jgi:hypothetical protein
VTEVKLYFLDDADGPPAEATGEEEDSGFPMEAHPNRPPVLPPTGFELERWGGEGWVSVRGQHRKPGQPTGRRANTVTFPEITTSRIRIVLRHRPGATAGLTELEAWGPGVLPLSEPTDPVTNLAWNPGDREFPKVQATFTSESDAAGEAVDGLISFTPYSRNRWTAFGSPRAEDGLEVDFGAPGLVARVELFFFGDGRRVGAPLDYRVELGRDGAWEEAEVIGRFPEAPRAWASNTVFLEPTVTSRVRVVFSHRPPTWTGVTELRIWSR